jgi:hypothetical protein
MCEKCDAIQKTIERYRRLQQAIADDLTVERTNELIAKLRAQIAALHPA